ncbi:MICOS complex subunit MIC10 [Drosophila takahashii]|uniref:MICOS complex subunit MIC10 n=1 Tax=Drosophila takahashii TaxID=29030 RepID=UPI001CF85F66|nr:MICOS complex subunit MIC10 [Drosophila takahashii]
MSHDPQKPAKQPIRESPVVTAETITTDKCLADFCLKGGSGLIIGSVFTLFFTRPQTYPIWLGLGFGMGMAYDCCQARWNQQ